MVDAAKSRTSSSTSSQSTNHGHSGAMGIAPEAMSAGEELRDLQGLSLNSSPVKASPSNQTRASSSDPAESVPGMPMFVESGDMDDVDDDDDEDGGRKGKKGQPNPGRRKIEIEYIEDKSKRHITFSKRKAGIMKKAYELSTLTGTQVLLLVVSETGLVYTYTTTKLQALVTAKEGKALIQACLTAEEGEPPFGNKADMQPAPTTRMRSDHRKVSMQVRMNGSNHNHHHAANGHDPAIGNQYAQAGPPMSQPQPSPGIPPVSMQQQQAQYMQPLAPQYVYPQQTISGAALMPPSAPMQYPQAPSNLPMPMAMTSIPPMPMPTSTPLPDTTSTSRTLKKRKTTDNLRTSKESLEQAEAKRAEALQLAQDCLEQARQHATIGNLLRAFQQQDVAARSKQSKAQSDGGIAEGLDSTIQLFQMSCEDTARGVEMEQARLRGQRWIDNVGVAHLPDAIDEFIHDFLVNKCIKSPKDVKLAAKDLQNFSDWLFAHSFAGPDLHQQLVGRCNSSTKSVMKKASEGMLQPGGMTSMSLPPMPLASNGLVQPAANPALRAEVAGKTLIDYCEFARKHYEGVGQEQGVTAVNGYFIVDRVRSSYVILRGIPIEGDPHSNSEPGPFKVRMPAILTCNLRPRDQFLLSLNRYAHINYWFPTACGDVHPTTDDDMAEDPLNSQYHHMELDKAQRANDQMAFNYHVGEFQFCSKATQLMDEGELPEDGFGGVSVQQVMHPRPSQPDLHDAASRPVRRQPSRAANGGQGWGGPQQF